MTDLAAAFSEVKSLPDDVLTKELNQPSGMIPGFIVLGELSDRKALRDTGGGQTFQKRPSMVDELLKGFRPEPMAPQQPQGFSEGGIISKMNPFQAYMEALQNPELGGGIQQEAINEAFNGQPPLMPLQQMQAPGAPQGLESLKPTAPGQLQRPPQYAGGGIVSLLK